MLIGTFEINLDLANCRSFYINLRNPTAGVLVCSIDNMPAQMPTEATSYFGSLLLPHMDDLVRALLRPLSPSPFVLITCALVVAAEDARGRRAGAAGVQQHDQARDHHELRQPHEGLRVHYRAAQTTNVRRNITTVLSSFEYRACPFCSSSAHKTGSAISSDTRRVLLLGAGMVSGPVVEYFGRLKNVQVTTASALQEDLNRVASNAPHVTPVMCDVQSNPQALDALVREHDVVISMLPYVLHPQACLLLF